MKSIEINIKWDRDIPTYAVRLGTSRFKNPGDHARVSPSGTDNTVNVLEVDAVSTFRDRQGLNRYVILHPNVAEAFGYEPSKETLKRKSVNVRVETPVPNRSIPACSHLTVYSQSIEAEVLKSYLKGRNYIVSGITEAVPERDIEKHTPYTFDRSNDEFRTFRPVDMSPSRSVLMVRETTDITVTTEPPETRNTASSGGATSSSSGPQQPLDRGDDGDASKSYDESETGEGFEVSPEPPEHTFDEIVGLETVKDRVSKLTALTDDELVNELENRYGEAVEDLLPDGYTLLLYGPPGCGKTMVAHGIANRFQEAFDQRSGDRSVAFISVKGSDILASLKGQSESRVEATFAEARRAAGDEGYAVLFFDEIETLIPDRNDPTTEATDSRLTVAFLQEMNKIGDNVMVIGATNLPFTIDSAASRRFKMKLFVEHPGKEGMKAFWKKQLEPLNTQTPIDYDKLGKASTQFTPAEVAAMLETEVQSDIVGGMINDNPQPLTTDYLEQKLEDRSPRTIQEYVSSVDQPDLLSQDQMQGYQELEQYIQDQKAVFESMGD